MLNLLEKKVWVVNKDSVSHTLQDVKGEFEIPPFENDINKAVQIPSDVWQRNYRRSWLVRATDIVVVAEPEPEPVETVEDTEVDDEPKPTHKKRKKG